MLSLEQAPPFPLRGRPFPIYRGSCTILPAYLSRFPSAMAETRLVKSIGWSFLILPRNHGGRLLTPLLIFWRDHQIEEWQATGQVLYLRPYANDFSATWVLSSVALLTVGSAFTTCIAEKISDLKLGNGASLLIFTNIISYLPASFGRTVSQAFQDENYIGLTAVVISFVLLIIGTVYVQEAERKIPLNYASRYSNKSRHLQKAAYLPFKVNSSGAMPMIFSISSLALPDAFACLTGSVALKEAVYALNPGGVLYHSTNILLIAFFNYYYTFLQLDPNDVSEQLKRLGASIPYVRPGKSTAAYLKTVLTHVSILGSTFLAALAVGPAVIEHMTHLTVFGGCAGTSVLILVDCATDMARKVQAEIISQKYKNIELYNIEKYGP